MNNLKYIARRKKLTEELRRKGIQSEKVLSIINKVPRHLFIDETLKDFSYIDKAYPIANTKQTISQPYTVALQTELLEIKEGDKILEIGTGSGYQTAILEEMGALIFSVERISSLHHQAFRILSSLGYTAKLRLNDGFIGWEAYAPFDKIILTAAPEEIPVKLLEQLKVGGIMVCPIGNKKEQNLLRIIKKTEKEYQTENIGKCAFVPMLTEIKE